MFQHIDQQQLRKVAEQWQGRLRIFASHAKAASHQDAPGNQVRSWSAVLGHMTAVSANAQSQYLAGTCYNGDCEGLHLSSKERAQHLGWPEPSKPKLIVTAGRFVCLCCSTACLLPGMALQVTAGSAKRHISLPPLSLPLLFKCTPVDLHGLLARRQLCCLCCMPRSLVWSCR